ncbi:hypothetical protein ABTY59_34070 [Streptomyces sp. NPDC096079]|uniref:hypothetical protein n=1 Tax=Streptomyces sp. NPDC096079 TaxID=3155820 RepID=UPI003329907B
MRITLQSLPVVRYGPLYASAVSTPCTKRPHKMRQATTPFGHAPAYPAHLDVSEMHGVSHGVMHEVSHGVSPEVEPAPAPVFVDQSGLRSRLFRRFGWPVSVVGAILAAAMGGSLIGVQSDAPAMGIPPKPSFVPTMSHVSPARP